MDEEAAKPEKKPHPGSENLTPFQPGQSGNPGGRPKGSRNRATIIKEILESKAFEKFTESQRKFLGDDHNPQTVADQIAAAMVLEAIGGNVKAGHLVLDSAYGKLTDKVDNRHSFTQMGRVTAKPVGEKPDGVQMAGVELSFDVGAPVAAPEGADEEVDQNNL